ncbi:tetratricopeptide repeat protein [Symbiobacterium terraclitae]|uniref:tetratricopeptide repeat protein n=1 Tax=Symbiobacterium terraclitae TaxID=557451 RepID=UPI0035B51EAD
MNKEELSEVLSRADAAYARGSLDEALELYRQVLAEDETVAWAHSRTGAILAQKDDLAGAEAHLRRAIELDPNLPQAHSNLGNLDYARGDYAAALEKYKLAVKLDPNNPTFHENLHAAYKKLGRISEAVDAIKRAQRLKRQQVNNEIRQDMADLGSRVKRRAGCLPVGLLAALLLALLLMAFN